MIIGYRYTNTQGHRDITLLLSDRIKQTTYHELTHAAHYAALGFSFKEQTNVYSLKVGMIPIDTGTYLIAISNGGNITRSSDPCTKANYEIDFANIDQHLYLYQNNRPGYTINNYEKTHGYCFKVK